MDVLTFLGTACGIPMADRFPSSILLESGGRRWLLDAGEPCSQRLKAMDVPFASLDDPGAANRLLAYSIVYYWADKRLIYSADLGRPEDMAAILDRPCDLLICELAHFEPEELFAFLADKPVRRICLTHLTAEFAARAEEICVMGRETLRGVEVTAAADGMRVEF